jgi:hypothetical protein
MIGQTGVTWAQQQPDYQTIYQPILHTRLLVDSPTAGLLERGSFSVGMRAFPNGGLLGRISVGLTDRLNFGASFGGVNIIGAGEVLWNPHPGVQFAYRFFEESYMMPAIVIGYESQGYGSYSEDFRRYDVKSKGFYAVASKYYGVPFNLGVHVGVNYTQEDGDGDSDIDLFGGADVVLNEEFTIVADYDLGLNDNDSNATGNGKGFLNVGIRWVFANRLFVEFAFKDILQNKQYIENANRELKIVYVEYF